MMEDDQQDAQFREAVQKFGSQFAEFEHNDVVEEDYHIMQNLLKPQARSRQHLSCPEELRRTHTERYIGEISLLVSTTTDESIN